MFDVQAICFEKSSSNSYFYDDFQRVQKNLFKNALYICCIKTSLTKSEINSKYSTTNSDPMFDDVYSTKKGNVGNQEQ